jgi:hypothetical protein
VRATLNLAGSGIFLGKQIDALGKGFSDVVAMLAAENPVQQLLARLQLNLPDILRRLANGSPLNEELIRTIAGGDVEIPPALSP